MPRIPEKLSRIDEVTLAEHFSLDAADACFYIWEYAARKGYDAGPTNQLIKNLKIKPGEIARTSGRQYYKQQAISHAAKAMRGLLGQRTAEGPYSFVPIPCSKAIGDTEHDDRITLVLQQAFSGWNADVQPILRVRHSMQADHERTDRMTHEELLVLTELVPPAKPLRPTIVILDDVLNSGKHFKVAKSLLSAANPAATIMGLFVARCTRNSD